MSSALKLLKEKIAQTRVAEQRTKPTKAPFVGFVSNPLETFPGFHLRWRACRCAHGRRGKAVRRTDVLSEELMEPPDLRALRLVMRLSAAPMCCCTSLGTL